MLAFATMAAIRHRTNTMPNKQTMPQIFVWAAAYPLVDSGNPPHRKPARTAAHRQASRHRLVASATSPSRGSKASPSKVEAKIATVMLVAGLEKLRYTSEFFGS